MLKRILVILVLVGGFSFVDASDANAWVVRRFAPVRRIAPVRRATRAILPPYRIGRRVVAGPVYQPVVYGAPVVYGPAVSVGVGYGYGYGW